MLLEARKGFVGNNKRLLFVIVNRANCQMLGVDGSVSVFGAQHSCEGEI